MKEIIKKVSNLGTLEATQNFDVPTTFIKEIYSILSEFLFENVNKTSNWVTYKALRIYYAKQTLKVVKYRIYKNFI